MSLVEQLLEQKHSIVKNYPEIKIMHLHQDGPNPRQLLVPKTGSTKVCIFLEVRMKIVNSSIIPLRFHLQVTNGRSGGYCITLKVLNQHTFQVETSAKK